MGPPASLVVDANVLFSFFKSDSGRRRMILRLRREGCRLLSPDYVFEELTREMDRINRVANTSETEFAFVLSLLERTVETVEQEQYWECAEDAAALAPHEKDVPYFALALQENAPIWSDETAFRAQDTVTVFTTEGLYDVYE